MMNAQRLRFLRNRLYKVLFALRTREFAAAMILVFAGIEGNVVDLPGHAAAMNSYNSQSNMFNDLVPVGKSDSKTLLRIQPISRNIISVADVIASVLERITDSFRISGRGDRSNRINRIGRIARIDRVVCLDRIYPAIVRSTTLFRALAHLIDHDFYGVPLSPKKEE